MSNLSSADLNKYGPFGRYNNLEIVTNKSVDFSSGSRLGAAAVIRSGSDAGGYIDLAGGGRMHLGSMTAGVLYEIGIKGATSNSADEHILVLRR